MEIINSLWVWGQKPNVGLQYPSAHYVSAVCHGMITKSIVL